MGNDESFAHFWRVDTKAYHAIPPPNAAADYWATVYDCAVVAYEVPRRARVVVTAAASGDCEATGFYNGCFTHHPSLKRRPEQREVFEKMSKAMKQQDH